MAAVMAAAIGIAASSVLAVNAFPGAEGSGRDAVGGRGGAVYEVTNLNNSGAGSIVDALSQGNRTIVFRVSGTIQLNGVMLYPQSNTTIAGQTAPGDGICIKGRIHIKNNVHDIVIRYIRLRVDAGAPNSAGDAIDIDYGYNIVIDHVSASYARDETISCQETTDHVTVQWCLMSEALTGEGHSYGSLIRGTAGQVKTYHHNLYAHNQSRNPRPGNYTSGSTDPEGLHFDFRNNVVYNWLKTCPGYGDSGNYISRYNFIGNVYIPAPESTSNGYGYRESSAYCYGYYADNSYNNSVPADPWSIVLFDGLSAAEIAAYKAHSYLVPMEPVTTTSPAQAKIDVLAGAGASLPKRDIIDNRIVNDVLNKTGHSISDTTQQPEGGWPALLHAPYPQDSDHDGMPDWWEDQEGSNSADPADRNGDPDADGYTNVEDYLNYLAAAGTTMGWGTSPHGMGAGSISMTAATAIDPNGVQYYFQCTSGGGHDSGWQTSPSYTDTGLIPLTAYGYRVKTRCATNLAETQYSATATSTPEAVADTIAPTPDPMTWASQPSATGIDTITMTATTAHDSSGVEYFFANITDPNHNSGWQDGTTYTDTGLTNSTTYAYRVIARDKSANHNETGWSTEAEATTIRYDCTATITGDLNSDCQLNFLDLAGMASSWGVGSAPAEMIVNGGFSTGIDSWLFASVSGATGTMATSFDGTVGEPAGSALITADNAVATNGHRFYQVFPVISGKQYTFSGRWSGNIAGLVTNPTGGTLRNWAEVIMSFESSTTPSNWTASSAIKYKKAYGAGTTNTSTGVWGWEDITASPNGTIPPAGGVFTATAPYMVVSFNLGGRVGSGAINMHLDNVSVKEAVTCPSNDLNGDCVLNWLDMLQLANNWLVCNRNPSSECWQ